MGEFKNSGSSSFQFGPNLLSQNPLSLSYHLAHTFFSYPGLRLYQPGIYLFPSAPSARKSGMIKDTGIILKLIFRSTRRRNSVTACVRNVQKNIIRIWILRVLERMQKGSSACDFFAAQAHYLRCRGPSKVGVVQRSY